MWNEENELSGARQFMTTIFSLGKVAFKATLGAKSGIVTAGLILFMLLPILICTILPLGMQLHPAEVPQKTMEDLRATIDSEYYDSVISIESEIRDYVKKNCGGGSPGHLRSSESEPGKWIIESDTCSVTLSFCPDVNTVATNITAYINAVNGTIAYFGEQTMDELAAIEAGVNEPIPTYEDGPVLSFDENEMPVMTEDATAWYAEHSDEYTNAVNLDIDDAEQLIYGGLFVPDKETKRWETVSMGHVTKSYKDKDGNKHYYPYYTGEIEILMFYDLSSYKFGELSKCYELVGKNIDQGFDEVDSDPVATVNQVLTNYYYNIINRDTLESGGVIELDEGTLAPTLEETYHKLIDDGTYTKIPVSGVPINGAPGYTGDIENETIRKWAEYAARGIYSEIWNQIARFRCEGVCGKNVARYNCTEFAQAWVYVVYGQPNAIWGDGKYMVDKLLSTDWGKENFYLASGPAPGAIVSVGNDGVGNHVICIMGVDNEAQTITIAHGNTTGGAEEKKSNSTIAIKTISFSEYDRLIKYIMNKTADGRGFTRSWVKYAAPKREEDRIQGEP